MEHGRQKSITRRISVVSIAIVISGILMSLAGNSWFIFKQEKLQLGQKLEEQLNVLTGSLIEPLWSYNHKAIQTIGETYTAHKDIVSLVVLSGNDPEPVYSKKKSYSGRAIYRKKDVRFDNQIIGHVEAGVGMTSYDSAVGGFIWFSVTTALFVSLFIFVGMRYSLNAFLKTPLNTLSQWATKVSSGQYNVKSSEIGIAELSAVASKFQEMAETIAAREMELAKLSMATEQSPASVIITDADGRIEYVNSAFEKVTGYSEAEVLGQSPGILKSGKTPPSVYRELWQSISGGNPWHGEFMNRRKSGEHFWERLHIAPVLDESGVVRHYLSVGEDITLQKQQEEQIVYQAHFDALTGLPNRFLSLDRLGQMIKDARRSGRSVAVLFLDLDDFKKVNDTLGHEVGDKLLVQAAQRLNDAVREGDSVGRLGGDEFIVQLSSLVSAADAGSVAENLLEQFHKPFLLDGRSLVLTASLGIAVYPDDGDNPAELLRNADTAMYHSKDHGRNTYHFFTDAMNEGVSRRLALEEQLHGALERGEFHLCYQPLVDVQHRIVVGAEALLRWDNALLGSVPPSEFIPVAEHTGIIVAIGQFVLQEALAMAVRCQDEFGASFRMAVNLSPRQFRDPELVPFIERLLQQAKVGGEIFRLEITEGVLMSGHAQVYEAMQSLSRLGTGIAMDDFGTGYSSLSYLRRFPFDTLKIDRSFVNDITFDTADRELVNAAIGMAHGLGLSVVAEGVETEEQLAILHSQGCDFAQGYLFSRPVPVDEFMHFLTRWRAQTA